ncbi:DUF2975 domain-containing protein [Planomicrobium sp. YIM 101495]|uniref:DUF2975 domain-containing protein n=1 Tax=Planomicrobium sp. YIM 101495 TaxID=2665160 RepID=UPI0012B98148|nr:DUF2975 domain-containing protein [Planomicrobium sp. YIM 101495]MTD30618.1 DUF2975 domain-containing protein [Planomicrobium sp. YIM 101495]
MKKETWFLKMVVVFMALPVLAGCIFVLPGFGGFIQAVFPALPFLPVVFLLAVYSTAILYFAALYQTLKLLSFIDKGVAFSHFSVRAIQLIKRFALIIAGIYILCLPVIVNLAEVDDAPGLGGLGMIIPMGALVIAVFAAVLQKLLEHAIEMKAENELTI